MKYINKSQIVSIEVIETSLIENVSYHSEVLPNKLSFLRSLIESPYSLKAGWYLGDGKGRQTEHGLVWLENELPEGVFISSDNKPYRKPHLYIIHSDGTHTRKYFSIYENALMAVANYITADFTII